MKTLFTIIILSLFSHLNAENVIKWRVGKPSQHPKNAWTHYALDGVLKDGQIIWKKNERSYPVTAGNNMDKFVRQVAGKTIAQAGSLKRPENLPQKRAKLEKLFTVGRTLYSDGLYTYWEVSPIGAPVGGGVTPPKQPEEKGALSKLILDTQQRFKILSPDALKQRFEKLSSDLGTKLGWPKNAQINLKNIGDYLADVLIFNKLKPKLLTKKNAGIRSANAWNNYTTKMQPKLDNLYNKTIQLEQQYPTYAQTEEGKQIKQLIEKTRTLIRELRAKLTFTGSVAEIKKIIPDYTPPSGIKTELIQRVIVDGNGSTKFVIPIPEQNLPEVIKTTPSKGARGGDRIIIGPAPNNVIVRDHIFLIIRINTVYYTCPKKAGTFVQGALLTAPEKEEGVTPAPASELPDDTHSRIKPIDQDPDPKKSYYDQPITIKTIAKAKSDLKKIQSYIQQLQPSTKETQPLLEKAKQVELKIHQYLKYAEQNKKFRAGHKPREQKVLPKK